MLENGKVIEPTDEQKKLESIKSSIKAIEGLFHALNDSGIPMKWHDAVLAGMQFIGELHAKLISELPKDEIEKIKKEQEPIKPALVN